MILDHFKKIFQGLINSALISKFESDIYLRHFNQQCHSSFNQAKEEIKTHKTYRKSYIRPIPYQFTCSKGF
jgi:trehalose-6-phosphate synthase